MVAIDAKAAEGGWIAYTRSGSAASTRGAVEWAREAAARGAGEILLTSMDRDGTKSGFDCALTAAVSDAVPIPVIASGGAGSFDHFAEVFTAGHADAALAASIFHFNTHGVAELKQFLHRPRHPRPFVTGPVTPVVTGPVRRQLLPTSQFLPSTQNPHASSRCIGDSPWASLRQRAS